MQDYRVFFGEDDPLKLPMPTLEERQWAVSRENPSCPLSKFVGNEKALKKLQAAAFDALGKPDHLCRELAFALFGPASSGKTTLAKMYAVMVQLPFIEISPKSVKTMEDIFREIERVLKVEGVPLVEIHGRKHYILPPCVIFLDEVHAFSNSVIQGLLKPTEYNDGVMITEDGKTINCFNVCWMLATTEEGKLFDAFHTRFSPVNLKYLTRKEIAKIIGLANPDFPVDVCELVAHYNSKIPRKALEFARYMKLIHQMNPCRSWSDVAKEVATDEGIDEHGMHEKVLEILKALGKGPIARNRMVTVSNCKAEALDKFIMPQLLVGTDDCDPLVTVSSKGFTITEAGKAELLKRGLVS